MRYIKNGRIAADAFERIDGGDPLPEDRAVIVSSSRLMAADGSTGGTRVAPLGVIWPNHEPIAVLAPHLSRLALVGLVFPSFRDGRAYTQARQLREEHGFSGELRATGDVLRDQFLFMVRAGFDAFEVKKDADAEGFAKALHEFTVLYQPAADRGRTPFRIRLQSAARASGMGEKAHV